MMMAIMMTVGLFMPGLLSAEKFIGENVEIKSVQPPQYMGYRLYTGVVGGTTIYYKVSAIVTGIGETRASAILTVSDANAVLSSTNTLQLIWARVSDATSYNVYKSTLGSTSGFYLLGNVAQGTYTLNDLGQTVGSAYSAPTVVGGDIEAEGDITAGDDLIVAGDATVAGAFTATGALGGAAITGTTLDMSGAADIDGQVTMGAAGTKSTMTAAGALTTNGAIVSGGAITATAGVIGTTGSFSGAADVAGQFTWGTAGTKSTGTITGNLSIPGDLVVTGSITGTGGFFPVRKTQSEIEAITSSTVGEMYICTDCTVTLVCGSSVTASATSWCSLADIAVACD